MNNEEISNKINELEQYIYKIIDSEEETLGKLQNLEQTMSNYEEVIQKELSKITDQKEIENIANKIINSASNESNKKIVIEGLDINSIIEQVKLRISDDVSSEIELAKDEFNSVKPSIKKPVIISVIASTILSFGLSFSVFSYMGINSTDTNNLKSTKNYNENSNSNTNEIVPDSDGKYNFRCVDKSTTEAYTIRASSENKLYELLKENGYNSNNFKCEYR